MNRVILIGRVGNTPEVKTVGSSKVCKFSLATSETYVKDGQKITDTDWHNVVFWGKQCDTIEKYVHKGDLFCVTGKSKTRKYEDKSGVAHWATEIVCNEFEFVQGKKDETPQAKDEFQGKKPLTREDILNEPDDRPF